MSAATSQLLWLPVVTLRDPPHPVCGFACRWVDRLAVPQERSQLQNTLLSRMLIVYASCQATLAIRTQESKEELRYHRRAWTLQVGSQLFL